MRCYAYSYSHAFELRSLKSSLAKSYNVTPMDDAIHCKLTHDSIPDNEGDIFIFPYGTFIAWGLTETLEENFKKALQDHLGEKLGSFDTDLYTYGYGAEPRIKNDHITLPNHDILSKLACAYGLSQSVKLGGFENTIQNTFEKTKSLPESLAKNGTIDLSRRKIRKLMGHIFLDRTSINLHLDLLDAPNFFWDHTELEPLHEMITDYMDQDKRVEVLNQRLAVMQELTDMLGSELNHQHSSKLEWIIIILIFIEIVILVAKDIFHWV